MAAQPTPIPPRMSTGPMNLQPPPKIPSSQMPSDIQLQRLPFVDAPPASTKNYSADNTNLPSTHETRSKSSNRQGIKQSSSAPSSASTSTGKSGPICWNCGEVGHRRRYCPNPPYCSKCKQKGHLPVKCPLKGKRNETSQMPQKVQQMSVDQRFSSIKNKCIHCGGDHAPGSCPTKTQAQATPNTAGYQMYNSSTGAGKVNNNASLSFSSKNGQPAAASMTPSSPVINSSGVPGHSSCAPRITPQVSPSTSQQNSYNMPLVHPPNQFPPPPYFPIPFPPPLIAPSNVSNATRTPQQSQMHLKEQRCNLPMPCNKPYRWESMRRHKKTRMQGWTSSLKRSRFLMVLNHPSVTHGSRRYTPYVFKQGGLSTKCCYYVQVKLSVTLSRTCPRKQRMTKSRMTS